MKEQQERELERQHEKVQREQEQLAEQQKLLRHQLEATKLQQQEHYHKSQLSQKQKVSPSEQYDDNKRVRYCIHTYGAYMYTINKYN